MKFTDSFIKNFAQFSIIVAVLHFIGESYFMYLYGQSFIQTSIDVVAVSLMLIGSIFTLKNVNYNGILCGSWGFSFCLNFRAWAWRFETENYKNDPLMSILLIFLLFSFVAFIISILINLPKTNT
jgi:hypothetical protein